MGYSYSLNRITDKSTSVEWFTSLRTGNDGIYFHRMEEGKLPARRVQCEYYTYGERVFRPIRIWRHVIWWMIHGRGASRTRWIRGLLYAWKNEDAVFVES